jgi:Ca-activated chloride channel family protein
MNTINTCYFQHIKTKRSIVSKSLNIFHKSLLVVSVYLVFGLLFQHVYANAKINPGIDPYQTQHGSVWLLPDNGIYLEAMQMQTDVDYEITGSIARAKVKQRFKNSSSLWAEGIYVFPLPEKAAVDHFRMVIGERIIEGKIKERVTAKKIYERAKAAGKKASLIEQQRPNVFTTSLANIAPGEEITVEFEFQQLLDYKDDSYRLRFPMVVGPRYHTGHNHTGQTSIQSLTNPAPTNPASNETSVYTETDLVNNTNSPVRIHVLLDAGVSLYDLSSSYHRININQTSETRYSISTIGKNITADRDFELVWQPRLNHNPQLSAFNEKIDNDNGSTGNYTMVTLLPPDLSHLQQKVQARDVVFVIDVSGSMAGTSIEQAKASLITALDGLSSIDRFNIIWFNHETGRLFPKAVPASAKYKGHAALYIQQLQADGGTEMLPALKLALSNQETFSRFRQVIFITDGNISNETELFNVIDKQLANSRLFTIGIGSAPNSYFMRKAAQKGRGTFTYIGDINEVHKKTTALFKKLETPALINIQLEVDKNSNYDDYEIFPKIIPDLYAGETASLLIKGKTSPRSITLKGDYGNSEWQSSAKLKTTSQSGIRLAWAREKISSLMNQHHESANEVERESIQQEVTNTALQHHLVSRYTSLVAVDVTPVNADGMLYRERLKNNLPFGWKNPTSVNGLMLAQAATSSRLNFLLAMILFITGTLLYRWKNTDK